MMTECSVCGSGIDSSHAMYELRLRHSQRRSKFVVCDYCRATIIDAQATTMTMKTDDVGAHDAATAEFTRLGTDGSKTRDKSSIVLSARAVRALPVRVARPLGLKV